MTLSVAQAEQPTQYFAIGHKMMTMETSIELDVVGTQLTYGKRINDKLVLEGNLVTYYDLDYTNVTSIDLSALVYPLNNQFHIRVGLSDAEAKAAGVASLDDTAEIFGVGYSWLVGSSGGST